MVITTYSSGRISVERASPFWYNELKSQQGFLFLKLLFVHLRTSLWWEFSVNNQEAAEMARESQKQTNSKVTEWSKPDHLK